MCISIHAPAWGATSSFDTTTPDGKKFQSTPPRGGRPDFRRIADWSLFISIHAPAWGATPRTTSQYNARKISIHAPAWGATTLFPLSHSLILKFQSTPPRGGRHYPHLLYGAGRRLFQSTPPRGGRPETAAHGNTIDRFQSTPPRGGRQWRERMHHKLKGISIHAPVWGATPYIEREDVKSFLFQSTPPCGGRPDTKG